MRLVTSFVVLTLCWGLVGCGGGDARTTSSASSDSAISTSVSVSSSVSSVRSSTAARGELIHGQPLQTLAMSAVEFTAQLNASLDGKALMQITGTPTCGIDVRYVQYGTVGSQGEPTTASGVLMIPTGAQDRCAGARDIILYAHGTALSKHYNLANMQDDMNEAQGEAYVIAAMYAAQGYIVVAPNYAGYDSSSLTYHPYLNADQQSKEMIDILAAAKNALPNLSSNVVVSAKLFVTGYSEGGHVAMATHRAMQAAGIPVTASAPMSGPYALAARADATFYGYVNQGGIPYSILIATSMQRAFGNIYANPSEFYEAAYASGIENVLPSARTFGELVATGVLPSTSLFNTSSLTPATVLSTAPLTGVDANLLFASGFGANNLIKNSVRQAYLVDAAANPDGTFPIMTNGLPAAAPENGLRAAIKKNDLRGWVPTSPVLLCGGKDDPQVFFALNTKAMETLWAGLPAGRITVLDVDSFNGSQSQNEDPYLAIKAGFAETKSAIAAKPNGASTVFDLYHGSLIYPFCNAAARSFFSQF